MIFRSILVLTVLVSSRISSEKTARHLPTYFPRCYRSDPNLNDCLLKATEQVKPYLSKGVPELDFPPTNPFLVPQITLEQGTNSVDYKAALKNLTIRGLDDYRFKKFDFDVENLVFYAVVQTNRLTIEGDYFINGKLLTVPIEGKGRLVTNISNTNSNITMSTKLVNENGVKFLMANETKVSIDVGDVTFKINGLFDGNEVLAKAVRNVVRENIRELIEEVKPTIENVLVEILNTIINNTVGTIDFEELYPIQNKSK